MDATAVVAVVRFGATILVGSVPLVQALLVSKQEHRV